MFKFDGVPSHIFNSLNETLNYILLCKCWPIYNSFGCTADEKYVFNHIWKFLDLTTQIIISVFIKSRVQLLGKFGKEIDFVWLHLMLILI